MDFIWKFWKFQQIFFFFFLSNWLSNRGWDMIRIQTSFPTNFSPPSLGALFRTPDLFPSSPSTLEEDASSRRGEGSKGGDRFGGREVTRVVFLPSPPQADWDINLSRKAAIPSFLPSTTWRRRRRRRIREPLPFPLLFSVGRRRDRRKAPLVRSSSSPSHFSGPHSLIDLVRRGRRGPIKQEDEPSVRPSASILRGLSAAWQEKVWENLLFVQKSEIKVSTNICLCPIRRIPIFSFSPFVSLLPFPFPLGEEGRWVASLAEIKSPLLSL